MPGCSECSFLTQLSVSDTTSSHSPFHRTAFWSSHPSNLLRKEKKALGALNRMFLRARPGRFFHIGQRCLGQSSGTGQELNCKVH